MPRGRGRYGQELKKPLTSNEQWIMNWARWVDDLPWILQIPFRLVLSAILITMSLFLFLFAGLTAVIGALQSFGEFLWSLLRSLAPALLALAFIGGILWMIFG